MKPKLLSTTWAGDVANLVVCLHSTHETLGLIPSMKLGMVEHTYNPHTQGPRTLIFVWAKGSEVQGYLLLHRELEA